MKRIAVVMLLAIVTISVATAARVYLGVYHKPVTGVTIEASAVRVDTVAIVSVTSAKFRRDGFKRPQQVVMAMMFDANASASHADSMPTMAVYGCVNKQRVSIGTGDSILVTPSAGTTGAEVPLHNLTDSVITVTRNRMVTAADSLEGFRLWWWSRDEDVK